MERSEMVQRLADAIMHAIKTTQPRVCCFGEFDRFAEDGETVIGTDIGFDGYWDMYALADALFGRIS